MKRAKKHLDKCEDTACIYNSGHCCFGLRSTMGCYNENPKDMERQVESMAFIQMESQKQEMGKRLESMKAGKKIEVSGEKKLIDDITINKVFDFIFKGHHYTVADSARMQACCPHCNNQCADGVFWSKDEKGYIGTKKVAEKQFVRCFECPKCFEKFFYHSSNAMEGDCK